MDKRGWVRAYANLPLSVCKTFGMAFSERGMGETEGIPRGAIFLRPVRAPFGVDYSHRCLASCCQGYLFWIYRVGAIQQLSVACDRHFRETGESRQNVGNGTVGTRDSCQFPVCPGLDYSTIRGWHIQEDGGDYFMPATNRSLAPTARSLAQTVRPNGGAALGTCLWNLGRLT
jgi:hypothetical protein